MPHPPNRLPPRPIRLLGASDNDDDGSDGGAYESVGVDYYSDAYSDYDPPFHEGFTSSEDEYETAEEEEEEDDDDGGEDEEDKDDSDLTPSTISDDEEGKAEFQDMVIEYDESTWDIIDHNPPRAYLPWEDTPPPPAAADITTKSATGAAEYGGHAASNIPIPLLEPELQVDDEALERGIQELMREGWSPAEQEVYFKERKEKRGCRVFLRRLDDGSGNDGMDQWLPPSPPPSSPVDGVRIRVGEIEEDLIKYKVETSGMAKDNRWAGLQQSGGYGDDDDGDYKDSCMATAVTTGDDFGHDEEQGEASGPQCLKRKQPPDTALQNAVRKKQRVPDKQWRLSECIRQREEQQQTWIQGKGET